MRVVVPAPLWVKAPVQERLVVLEEMVSAFVPLMVKLVPVMVPLPVIDPLPRVTAPTVTL